MWLQRVPFTHTHTHACLNSGLCESKGNNGRTSEQTVKPVGLKIAKQANNAYGIKVTDSYVSVRRLLVKDRVRECYTAKRERERKFSFSRFHFFCSKNGKATISQFPPPVSSKKKPKTRFAFCFYRTTIEKGSHPVRPWPTERRPRWRDLRGLPLRHAAPTD